MTMVVTGEPLFFELLGHLSDLNVFSLTDVLSICIHIGILETTPASDVVNQSDGEIRGA